MPKKKTMPEVNMSRNPPGAGKVSKQKEPGVSDETRVTYGDESNPQR